MDSVRKSALVTGVLFIVTFITSIPALGLYGPVLNDSHYILGAGADTRIFVGAFLEVLLAISGIGTAVAIFPVVKRQNESIALGYVAARIVESTIIAVGIISLLAVVTMRREYAGSGVDPTSLVIAGKTLVIISLLAVVTMRRDFAGSGGADATTLVIAGHTLVAIHKWTFLLGPGYCAGIENGLMLGYLIYRSGLVPRPIAVLGLIGGTLAFVAATAELFGLFPQVSAAAAILVLPEALFEASMGIWLTFKGFRPSPITAAITRQAENSVAPGPAAA